MAKIWFRLIQKGLKTIEEVPQKYKEEVEAFLSEREE